VIPFPGQSTDHMSMKFKREVLKAIGGSNNVLAGVRMMVGTLFINPDQPTNMNVIIRMKAVEGRGTQTIAHVLDDNFVWVEKDVSQVISLMIQKHIDVIGTLSREVGHVDKSIMDLIKRRREVLVDTEEAKDIKEDLVKRAKDVVEVMCSFMKPYKHFYAGIAGNTKPVLVRLCQSR
jgi:hypothetical protein